MSSWEEANHADHMEKRKTIDALRAKLAASEARVAALEAAVRSETLYRLDVQDRLNREQEVARARSDGGHHVWIEDDAENPDSFCADAVIVIDGEHLRAWKKAEARVAELEKVHVEADHVRAERNATAASVLGGLVEGKPTGPHNWIQRARALREIEASAEELLEVADLRGDSDLPHPSDDPALWTARMQTAWDELRYLLAPTKEESDV